MAVRPSLTFSLMAKLRKLLKAVGLQLRSHPFSSEGGAHEDRIFDCSVRGLAAVTELQLTWNNYIRLLPLVNSFYPAYVFYCFEVNIAH